MATKSILTVRQLYRPSFAPRTRSTRDSSGKLDRTGHDTHFSSDKRLEMGKQSSSEGIAIVDDEEELCSLFSILIKSLGYHAECVAHDGDEIVQAVMEDSIHPDLIVMDYRM